MDTASEGDMARDAVDTARARINDIRQARTRAGAARYHGQADGLLEFMQVWSILSPDVSQMLRMEALDAYAAWVETHR